MEQTETYKTLRDEIAIAAMAEYIRKGSGHSSEEMARLAYRMADLMLKAREVE
jgi:hypothetical protein